MSVNVGTRLPAYTRHLMRVKNVQNAFSDPVPVGYTWVVRTISIAYGGLIGTEVQFFIHNLLVIDLSLFTQPSGPSYVHALANFALDAGENMNVVSTAQDQGVDCYVTGYQLLAG